MSPCAADLFYFLVVARKLSNLLTHFVFCYCFPKILIVFLEIAFMRQQNVIANINLFYILIVAALGNEIPKLVIVVQKFAIKIANLIFDCLHWNRCVNQNQRKNSIRHIRNNEINLLTCFCCSDETIFVGEKLGHKFRTVLFVSLFSCVEI